MTTKYRIRALVQADLESIWLYTCEQWGVEQADTYLNALILRFEWLADNPTLGKSRDDIKQGYFCFPEGMHLVFYIINEQSAKNKMIEIIGIPHQQMGTIEYLG
ncbi:MAG TPA: type II toxin-antitoxin system RelE/ParE family toxin [Gammaproteobacteria bacterium]|nr:type II toxin-antitoxin system RelE/ParE family toxin [Gammaproteobacteria bacterium]